MIASLLRLLLVVCWMFLIEVNATNYDDREYVKIAKCKNDWNIIDPDYSSPVGTVKIKVSYGKEKTKTKVIDFDAAFAGVDTLPTGSTYASHIHLLACNDISTGALAGGHWLKDPTGPDDPTNAVFNDLEKLSWDAPISGQVVSNFVIAASDTPFMSYMIHNSDGDRILCCDLSVKERRLKY